jgi:citrate lyase beta subunit
MLQKSLGTGADVIVYDLEDSVAPSPEDKANARANLKKFLKVHLHEITYGTVLSPTRKQTLARTLPK